MRESDSSPPSSAKVKNEWRYSATYIFMACAHAALLLVYGVRENIFSLFLVVIYGKFNDSSRRCNLQGFVNNIVATRIKSILLCICFLQGFV